MLIGLMVLLFFAAFCLAAGVAARFGWKKGREDGGSRARALSFAIVAFSAVYLPLFYYQVPIGVAMWYGCARYGGFHEKEDPAQWYSANSVELQGFTRDQLLRGAAVTVTEDKETRFLINDMVTSVSLKTPIISIGPGLNRLQKEYKDTKTGRVLAVRVTYSIRSREDLRSWVLPTGCKGQNDALAAESTFRNSLIGEVKR